MKDLQIVKYVKKLLQINPAVDVFIAEYSVSAGSPLDETIINAIKNCDSFVLLWSQNSKFSESEYVPQEIGIAKGSHKTIFPVVLEDGLQLPGFIKELKYLPAYRDPKESLLRLRQDVFTRVENQQQIGFLILLIAALWLFNQK
jgi:hypothetical protein